MKNSRHTRILEIISDHVIETQDDLIEKLKESGYPVTQATVSRDIKQLGLIKTATKDGGYKYTATRNESSGNENKLKNIMRETIVNAQDAQNLIVVKTFSGMANAASKGVKIGRPPLTKDDIPQVFYRHYPAYKNKQLNVSELARVCDMSRTTVYKYIEVLEK